MIQDNLTNGWNSHNNRKIRETVFSSVVYISTSDSTINETVNTYYKGGPTSFVKISGAFIMCVYNLASLNSSVGSQSKELLDILCIGCSCKSPSFVKPPQNQL